MRFEDAVEIILKHEGGYSKHPSDPGGETNFGISKRAYPDLDIASLTREQAIELYRNDFWLRLRVDEMPDCLKLTFFDCAVNQGPAAATGLIQSLLGLRVDGLLGPETMRQISQVDPVILTRRFTTLRFNRYAQSKGFGVFGLGWLKRLADVSFMTGAGV